MAESAGSDLLSDTISSEEIKGNNKKKFAKASVVGAAGNIIGGALGISGAVGGKKYNPEQ